MRATKCFVHAVPFYWQLSLASVRSGNFVGAEEVERCLLLAAALRASITGAGLSDYSAVYRPFEDAAFALCGAFGGCFRVAALTF